MTSAIDSIAKRFGTDKTRALVEKGVNELKTKDDIEFPLLDLLGDVLEEALQSGTSPEATRSVVSTAISGMLSSLDAYGTFRDAEAIRKQNIHYQGQFGGLGIEIRKVKNSIEVVAPFEDGPASKAGIRTKDLITHIDGEAVDDLTLSQAVEKLRGRVGTSVELTMARDNRPPLKLSVVRSTIVVHGVKSELKADNSIGYVKIGQLNQQTPKGLTQVVEKIQSVGRDKISGYVIDLRNNSGGLLDSSIAVADLFLESGLIGTLKGRGLKE